jgi:hypothetical protein
MEPHADDVRIRPGDVMEGAPYAPTRKRWPGVLAAVAIAAAVGVVVWRSNDDQLSTAVSPDAGPAASAPASDEPAAAGNTTDKPVNPAIGTGSPS